MARLAAPPWFERLISDPNDAATIFWAAGTIAAFSTVPTVHWRHHDVVQVAALAGCAAVVTVARAVLRRRLRPWALNVDAVLAVTILSWITELGYRARFDFSALYMLLALFGGLYLGPVQAAVTWAYTVVTYGLVIAYAPGVSEPFMSWLTIAATGTLILGVVRVLVGMLRASSREDPLTRLPNRRTWDERIEEELERARRSGTPLSVVIIDIDRFKLINDERGHQEGDRILRLLAEAWRGTLRGGGDVVARIGGDEFAVISPGADAEGIARLVSRLADGLPPGVGCSFGRATWDGDESAASLFRRADEAMYQAKRDGRAAEGP